MRTLKEEETKFIIGGADIKGAVISAFKGIFTVFFEMGQAVGGAVRRIFSNKLCEL